MEFDTRPIPLKPETKAVLEGIRRSTEPGPAYGLDPEQAQELFESITEPMLDGAALPMVTLQQMRWYVRELARLFRSRYGYALGFQVELCLRKWAGYGMEPETMQYLLCEIVHQLRLRARPAPEPRELPQSDRAEERFEPGLVPVLDTS